MIKVFDRIKELSTTTNVGTFKLEGAAFGYSSFNTYYNSGELCFYAAVQDNVYEVGSGQYYFDGSYGWLTRNAIQSTNANNLVSFGHGVKEVFVTYPAKHAIYSEGVIPSGSVAIWSGPNTLSSTDNVALKNAPNVFTAKQSFSGIDHAGLQLNSLTTTQYNALTPANGDIFRDSTTDRIAARLARGTVELIDASGGQTIDSLKVTNLLDLRKSGTANLIQYSNNGYLRTDTSQLTLYNTGTGLSSLSFLRAGTTFTLASNISLGFSSSTEAGGGTLDTHLSQASTGVLQIGTTSTNALGSLLLTNLTASGTITTPAIILNSISTGTAPLIINGIAGQGNLQQWKNHLGTVVGQINNAGAMQAESFLITNNGNFSLSRSANTLLINTWDRFEFRMGNGTGPTIIDNYGNLRSPGNISTSGQLYVGSTSNYYDNPSVGTGRWQTTFAGTYTFKQTQSGQFMVVQLETSEGKLAGLQHWDVANANGRRLDLFSQPGVPITVRPANTLAMTWDTSGNTTAAGNLTASGTVLATSSGNAGRLEVQNGSAGNLILLGNSSTGNVTINNANTVGGAIDIQSRGVTALSISNTGNVTSTGIITGGDVWSSKSSGSNVYAYNSTNGEFVRIQSTGTITHSSGGLTFSGTGIHTFGTTNTVTMTAGVLTATGSITASEFKHLNWTLGLNGGNTGSISLHNSILGAAALTINQQGRTTLRNNLYIDSPSVGEAGIVLQQAGVDKWQLYDSGGLLRLYNATTATQVFSVSASTQTYTFGTTNTVTMTAGNITASGNVTASSMIGNSFRQSVSGAGIITNANGSRLSLFSNNTEVAYLDGANIALNASTAIRVGSGGATSGSYDTSISRASSGVWQLGTTANNALGSLLLTNLTASGTGQFDTIDLTVSGAIRGRWSGNGGIAMGSARGIGWAHESTGTAGIGTAFYLVSNGLVQLGTLGANANASLNLTNLTASGTITGGTITTANILGTGSVTIGTGTGYNLRWDNNGLYSNGFAQPLGTVSNPWGNITSNGTVACGNLTATGNLTASGTIDARTTITGHRLGYLGHQDSVTLGWPGSSYGGFQCGANGNFSWLSRGLSLAANATGVAEINNGTLGTLRDLSLRNLTASGTVTVGEGTASVPSLQLGSTATGFYISAGGTTRIGVVHAGSVLAQLASTDIRISNGMMFASSNSSTATAGSVDVSMSRASASTWQIGNGGVNASGSLNLTNLTATGNLTASGTVTANNLFANTFVPTATLTSYGQNCFIAGNVAYAVGTVIRVSTTTNPNGGSFDLSIGRLSANTWYMGDGGVNASGNLNLTNITANGKLVSNLIESNGANEIVLRPVTGSHGTGVTFQTQSGAQVMRTFGSGNPRVFFGPVVTDRSYRFQFLGSALVESSLSTDVSMTLRGHSSQAVPLFEAQNSSGSVVASISNAGNLTASGSGVFGNFVTVNGTLNNYSFLSANAGSASSNTWRFGHGWAGNYDTQFIFAYGDNAAKVTIDSTGAITAFGGYYVNVPASTSSSIRPLQHGNSFLRFAAPASGIPGNNTTVTGWDSVFLDATTGNVRLKIGGVDRLVLTNTDLTLTGNLIATGNITTSGALLTNQITRSNGTLPLDVYRGSNAGTYQCVRIPGAMGDGVLTNSVGVAGWLGINSTINQTGAGGSTDFLINRTETALGSGVHNFADFQVGGSSRWRVDRLGDQYFHDGANYTLISRAPGSNGRLRIFRPNSSGAIAVQIGGGNDEITIGQGSEGSFRVSGGGVQLGSAGSLLLDSVANSFTFRGSASTTMATLTGSGNLTTVGSITASGNVATNTIGTTSGSTLTINNDGNSRWQFAANEFILNGEIRPATNLVRTLGTSGHRWATVFAVSGDYSELVASSLIGFDNHGQNPVLRKNGSANAVQITRRDTAGMFLGLECGNIISAGTGTFAGNVAVSGTYLYGDTTTPFIRLSNTFGARIGYASGNSINCGGPVTILDSSSNERVRFQTSNGWMGVNTNNPLAPVHSVASSVSSPALIAQGMASQTAPVFEVRNSAATVVASITDAGNIAASGTLATIATTINQASTAGLNPDTDNTTNRPFRLQDAGTTWGYMAKWDTNTRFQMGDFRVTGNACQLRSVAGTQPITVFGLTVANFSNVALLTVNSSTGEVVSSPLASTINTGVASALTINPTLNQTGTAGSTNLLINRTETALGSGVHNFIDCQVGGVSRFSVSNAGNLTLTGLHSFTGTTTPGLQLKSLTTAQITTLAGSGTLPNGSLLVDSTTNLVNVRLSGETRELFVNGASNVASGTTSIAVGYTNTANAQGSSAFGNGNTSSGNYSSAFGYQNTASGYKSSVFGYGNTASGLYSSAVGYNNTASGESSSAVGASNTASGESSSAVGRSNTASSDFSSAVGYTNVASGTESSAFGFSNTASGTNSSAFGYGNTVSGVNSSAFGYSNSAVALNSVMVGRSNFSNTTGLASVAVGVMNNQTGGTLNTTTGAITGTLVASTVGKLSSAFGVRNTATGDFSSAFGYSNTTSGTNSSAVGNGNTASGNVSSAVGYLNAASSNYSSAVGYQNNTGGDYSSAVGSDNTASGNYSSAVGSNNTASGYRSSAVGASNTSSGENSSAFGYQNTASGYYSSAFGYGNTASGGSSAVGYGNTASGDVSSAVGYQNTASFQGSSAFGYVNTASGVYSSAFGYNNTASGESSSAVGASNTASGESSSAVGRSNSAVALNSVAIGRSNFSNTTGLASVAVGVMNNQTGGTLDTTTGAITGPLVASTVGKLSSAFGVRNTASGNFSSAVGYTNTASGNYSSAFGCRAKTTVDNTTEIGYWSSSTVRAGAVRAHGTGMVAMTVQDRSTEYTDGGATAGSEADNTLGRGMFAIRRNGLQFILDYNDAGTIKNIILGTAT